jgi:hypothetical protein
MWYKVCVLGTLRRHGSKIFTTSAYRVVVLFAEDTINVNNIFIQNGMSVSPQAINLMAEHKKCV